MQSIRRRIAEWTAEKVTGASKRMRSSRFREHPVERGDIVLLGDSLTEQGLWNEWFPALPVRNRGIGGDSTGGLLARVTTDTTPGLAAAFVLIGTNDLVLGVSDDEIVGNIRAILKRLRTDSPEAEIYLQSILPRKEKFAERIRTLNERLKLVCPDEGAVWIDLWPAFVDEVSALRAEYTLDDLHLTGRGYASWVKILRPLLAANR